MNLNAWYGLGMFYRTILNDCYVNMRGETLPAKITMEDGRLRIAVDKDVIFPRDVAAVGSGLFTFAYYGDEDVEYGTMIIPGGDPDTDEGE